MAMKHVTKILLKALSFQNVRVKASRQLADLKKIDFCKRLYQKQDYTVERNGYLIPVRVFYPEEKKKHPSVFLFFHGGGWSTDSIDTYQRICAMLANASEHIVISVDYRLAPEYKFPCGLLDCYEVARKLYQVVDETKTTLIGDSAGGNLAAAISLLARDRKEFDVRQQILIYPSLSGDYSNPTQYHSMEENGSDYVLTIGKLQDYIDLYSKNDDDKTNPYFAPMQATRLQNQPKTLIITAEYDPLRDEGEAYGERLKAAGNEVMIHRVKDAIHGYFALGIKHYHVQESFDIINTFLKGIR